MGVSHLLVCALVLAGAACFRPPRAPRSDQRLLVARDLPVDADAQRAGLFQKRSGEERRGRRRGRLGQQEVIDMFHQAKSLLKKGEKEQGQELLYKCLKLDASDGHSWMMLAKIEIETGNRTGARNVFTEAVKHVENVHLLQAWAVMERDEGHVDEARDLFARAAALDPGNSYVAHAWGAMEERQGDIRRAKQIYESALHTSPTPTVITSFSLLMAFHENNPEDALRLLREKAMDPFFRDRSDELYLAMAHIYENRLLKPDMASLVFEEALRRNPDGAHLRIHAAQLEMRQGNPERAEELLHEARNTESSAPYLYNTLAAFQARDGRIEEAQAMIREGIERFPFDGALLQTAGTLAHRAGDLQRARELFQEALKFRKHGSCYVAWAVVEEAWIRRKAVEKAGRKKNTAGYDKKLNEALNEDLGFADIEDDLIPQIRAAESPGSEGVAAVSAAASRATMPETMDDDLSALIAAVNSEAVDAPEVALFSAPKKRTLDDVYQAPIEFDKDWAATALEPVRRLFQEGINHDPNHGALYNAYAVMEARYGNITGARAIYSAGLAAGVKRRVVSLYHGAGNLEAANGNVEAARRLWKAGIAVGLRISLAMETTHFCYHSLGMSYLSPQQRQQPGSPTAGILAPNATAASLIFAEGLSRYPASSVLLLGAALTEVKRGDIAHARDFFRKSAAADRRHAQAWQAWAVTETRERNYEAAATLFECGIENCPSHGALYQAYGMLQLYRGDVKAARKLFATGISRDPSHVPLYQGWACLELRSKQHKRARELLLHALAQDRKHAPCWAALGELERQAGRPNDARETFRRGMSECPKSAQLYRGAARLEAEQLNFGRARRLFEEGLKRSPYDAPLVSAFAEFEASLGNIEALASLHHRALEIQEIFNADRKKEEPAGKDKTDVGRVLHEFGDSWNPLSA